MRFWYGSKITFFIFCFVVFLSVSGLYLLIAAHMSVVADMASFEEMWPGYMIGAIIFITFTLLAYEMIKIDRENLDNEPEDRGGMYG